MIKIIYICTAVEFYQSKNLKLKLFSQNNLQELIYHFSSGVPYSINNFDKSSNFDAISFKISVFVLLLSLLFNRLRLPFDVLFTSLFLFVSLYSMKHVDLVELVF